MPTNKFSKLLTSAALVCLLLAAPSQAEHPPEVKIGVLLALTGPYPMQGNAFREGLELAEEELNAAGGIKGQRVRLVIEDTVNEAKTALTAAKKLIAEDHVTAALMSSYPEYRTGGMEFERHKVPVVALWDSSPELDDMGEYIFGIGPWTPSSGIVSAAFARSSLKAKTAVVLCSSDPWAELVSQYFQERFEAAGGVVVKRMDLNPETFDFRSALLSVKALRPDVVFSPIINNIPTFYQQRKSLGLAMPFITADVVTQEHVSQAPDVFEGVYMTKNKDPDPARSRDVLNRYQKRFGKAALMPWFVTTAYDGVMLIAKAISESAGSSDSARDKLSEISNYHGATQDFTFTKAGSAPQMAAIHVFRAGNMEFLWEGE